MIKKIVDWSFWVAAACGSPKPYLNIVALSIENEGSRDFSFSRRLSGFRRQRIDGFLTKLVHFEHSIANFCHVAFLFHGVRRVDAFPQPGCD